MAQDQNQNDSKDRDRGRSWGWGKAQQQVNGGQGVYIVVMVLFRLLLQSGPVAARQQRRGQKSCCHLSMQQCSPARNPSCSLIHQAQSCLEKDLPCQNKKETTPDPSIRPSCSRIFQSSDQISRRVRLRIRPDPHIKTTTTMQEKASHAPSHDQTTQHIANLFSIDILNRHGL
eukprot:754942-Hanusia_phi.AAC.2